MDATVDGVMARMPAGYVAYDQTWEPNRFLRLENVGKTDVVNPWVTVNGKRKWRTLKELAEEAVKNRRSDGEKARAIWEFTRNHRFHACTWCKETFDAVKVFNVYGYDWCDDDPRVIADVWKAVGLESRPGRPMGHNFAEVFYDGDYHLFDGDEHGMYLKRDNVTVASEADGVRDHDLIKRTHIYGILSPDDRGRCESHAAIFGCQGKREDRPHGGYTQHAMGYTLRPGESMEWRWDHIGKQYTAGAPLSPNDPNRDGKGDLLAHWGEAAYSKLRNGKMRYAPDLTEELARRGMAEARNLAPASAAGLRPLAAGAPAWACWKIASACVIVGAKIRVQLKRAEARDQIAVDISADGKDWRPVWKATDQKGSFPAEIELDEYLSPRGKPQYAYYVRVGVIAAANPEDAAVERISFETDVQMAALALPELETGRNAVEYVDETEGPRQVRITHDWVERTEWHPPAAPVPDWPADGAAHPGTQVTLHWNPAAHPDGTAIADYRIQLSAFADMRWVLSPNFDKLLSNTAFRGRTRWTAPHEGLLNPETPYYWRVRARDARGIWGPWSEARSLVCDAPGIPLDVRTVADPVAGTVTLNWTPNSKGAAAKEFRIYASDEKGFTASDAAYPVRMGRGFCRDRAEYDAKKGVAPDVPTPPNFFAITSEPSCTVAAPGLKLPNANKCYYRVVAVDARGLRSGPSDYAEAPRPFIFTQPPAEVAVGQALSYEPGVLRSIGDLRNPQEEEYTPAFWDREELTYALSESPIWLKVHPQTGRVSGRPGPEAAGTHPVVLRVANGTGSSVEQAFRLKVVR